MATHITGPMNVTGSVTPYNTTATVGTQPYACTSNDYREAGTARIPLTGTTVTTNGTMVGTWPNPEGKPLVVIRAILEVLTTATSSVSIQVGQAANATTGSSNLIQTYNVQSSGVNAIADNLLSAGTGKTSVYMATTDYITASATAPTSSAGFTGMLFVTYVPI